MDIQGWLQRVDDEVQSPEIPKENEIPKHHSKHKKRRKRKRAAVSSSSSSSTTSRSARTTPDRRPQETAEREHFTASDSSSSSGSTSSSASDASLAKKECAQRDVFERRKRHPTRPDLYDPHSGTRKKRNRRKDNDEEAKKTKNKKTCKKQKRKRNDRKAGEDLVRTFRAQNVSKKRLTLHHSESAGMFRKGRASSPVNGRGLPDLAFSEMRFLQKSREHEEDPQENRKSRDKSRKKKDRASRQNEEISSYFGNQRPPLREKDDNGRVEDNTHSRHKRILSQDRGDESTRQKTEQARNVAQILPVELASKPFLGFGSRGPELDSASYLPWSETPPRQNTAKHVVIEKVTIANVPLEELRPRSNEGRPRRSSLANERTARSQEIRGSRPYSSEVPNSVLIAQSAQAQREPFQTESPSRTHSARVPIKTETMKDRDASSHTRASSEVTLKQLLNVCDELTNNKEQPHSAQLYQQSSVQTTKLVEQDLEPQLPQHSSFQDLQKRCMGRFSGRNTANNLDPISPTVNEKSVVVPYDIIAPYKSVHDCQFLRHNKYPSHAGTTQPPGHFQQQAHDSNYHYSQGHGDIPNARPLHDRATICHEDLLTSNYDYLHNLNRFQPITCPSHRQHELATYAIGELNDRMDHQSSSRLDHVPNDLRATPGDGDVDHDPNHHHNNPQLMWNHYDMHEPLKPYKHHVHFSHTDYMLPPRLMSSEYDQAPLNYNEQNGEVGAMDLPYEEEWEQHEAVRPYNTADEMLTAMDEESMSYPPETESQMNAGPLATYLKGVAGNTSDMDGSICKIGRDDADAPTRKAFWRPNRLY